MTQNKHDLRQQLLLARKSMTIEERANADARLTAAILDWWHTQRPACLAVYSAIRGEPQLAPCYAQLHALGSILALPVVLGRDQALGFARWEPGMAMDKDGFGVAIPAQPWTLLKPDAILIPCVGFNQAGYRLGYGGGFYDRTLAEPHRPETVGIAYRCGLAEFEHEAHDVALDRILYA